MKKALMACLAGTLVLTGCDSMPTVPGVGSNKSTLGNGGSSTESRGWQALNAYGHAKGMASVKIPTGPFDLAGLYRIQDQTQPLNVYIEDDGKTYENGQPASDPTPSSMTVLQLATLDPGSNVLYLARPCQYLMNNNCNSRYWTTHLYSPETMNSMKQGLMVFADMHGLEQVNLIGFSGGGVVAVDLAGRAPARFSSVRTLAAPLELRTFANGIKRTDAISGGLNPGSFTRNIARVPQIHYVGGRDINTRQDVAQAFVAQQADQAQAEVRLVPEAGHQTGWVQQWARLIQEPWPVTQSPETASEATDPLMIDDNAPVLPETRDPEIDNLDYEREAPVTTPAL